jgi:hypothetical protein
MKYPIGIQDFEKIRNDGYVYVDKTAFVYKLADRGSYYFLSRPRRFGKSLLISTMEAYFSGKKELFGGLAIEKLEQKWTRYPILHLDLNTERYVEPESLNRILEKNLLKWESIYGTGLGETSFSLRFLGIIERAAEKTGERVVILVDEYDKPLLETIDNDELQSDFRATLKAFYSVLKTQDRYIKFAFLTGVTKFGKVSIFSDLNNLEDLSMNEQYIDICGISEKELHDYFDEDVALLGKKKGMAKDECYAKLQEQYDGYHFRQDSIGIYNPFSLLNTLKNMEFSDYWFESGTPTFLVKLLKKSDYDLENIEKQELSGDKLNSIDAMSYNPIPVIYQSGYLTVKGYDKEFKTYSLGFPNKEVENGFINYLMPYFTPSDRENTSEFFIRNFVTDVRKGKPEEFLQLLQSMFDDNDYRIAGKKELYFQNAMYVIFKIMGFYTEVERTTSRGRIDVLIKTKDYIYVIELKLDGTVEEALRQIEEKGYAKPFAKDPRKLYKIGVNFSSETRGIEDWKIEE